MLSNLPQSPHLSTARGGEVDSGVSLLLTTRKINHIVFMWNGWLD